MDLPGLIEALTKPCAYPNPVEDVEVCQTHISAVFLAGPFAYKVKKPVRFEFVDFSTLARRRFYCEEELRLNRRLAPKVYHGVVPITQSGTTLRFEGQGEVVEWAVKMERLPAEATLAQRLRRGQAQRQELQMLARRLARFHAEAAAGPGVAAFGRYEVVAANARGNFEQGQLQIGTTVSGPVLERLRTLAATALVQLRPLIERRARQGIPRDTHGDLRLEHVYYLPGREPEDLVIIDCVEFNERFRFTDPVADMAFLVMDLSAHGRRDLADVFAESYFAATGDTEGLALLPFYTSYRAAVRAKVAGIKATEPEVPATERADALVRARARWLLALAELEEPDRKPCLVLIGGLPGSGKSTLAHSLAQLARAQIIRSDLVRKELAGLPGSHNRRASFGEGIYSREWTNRTYSECSRRAEALLFQGKRVIVDASFASDAFRINFLEAAARWGVPALFLLCKSAREVSFTRLANRRGDASDADWSIYQQAVAAWQPPGELTQSVLQEIATGGSRDESLRQAVDVMRSAGLRR